MDTVKRKIDPSQLIIYLIPLSVLFTGQLYVGPVSVFAILMLVLAVTVGIMTCVLKTKEQFRIALFVKPEFYRHNPTVLIGIWAFICILASIISGNVTNRINGYLLALAMTIIFVTAKPYRYKTEQLFDLICYAGLIIAAFLLLYYLTDFEITFMIGTIAGSRSMISSYVILWIMAVSFRYFEVRDSVRSWLYLAMALIGFLLLVFNHYVPGFWILTLFFLCVPVVLIPTAELVKRTSTLLGIFLFIVSNTVLLLDYTALGEMGHLADVSYDMEHSIYIDMMLAVLGMVFMRYWERMPENVDREHVVMGGLRKACMKVIALIGLGYVIIVNCGNSWESIENEALKSALTGFYAPLATDIATDRKCFNSMLSEQGIIFTLLVLIIAVLYLYRIISHISLRKPKTGELTLIAGVFAIEFIAGSEIGLQTAAAYMLFMIMAVYMEEPSLHMHLERISFDRQSENEE